MQAVAEPSGSPPTVVVLRALALGDLLTGLPSLRAARKAFPESHITVTCPLWLQPLALHTGIADSFIDGAIGASGAAWRPNDLGSRLPLEAAQLEHLLDAPRYPSLAINLRGVRPATHQALLALFPERYIGYAHPEFAETLSGPEWDPNEHEVARWCRLMNHFDIPASTEDLLVEPPSLHEVFRAPSAVVLHPGAGSPARLWPEDRWAEVARRLVAAGERVVVTGGPGERALAERVASRAGIPSGEVVAGRLAILDMLALVDQARLVLSTDTGVAHLAFATGTASVTLYGPMPPHRWGPPSRAEHRVLWSGKSGEPYGPVPDPTILAISVESVWDAARSMLARGDSLRSS